MLFEIWGQIFTRVQASGANFSCCFYGKLNFILSSTKKKPKISSALRAVFPLFFLFQTPSGQNFSPFLSLGTEFFPGRISPKLISPRQNFSLPGKENHPTNPLFSDIPFAMSSVKTSISLIAPIPHDVKLTLQVYLHDQRSEASLLTALITRLYTPYVSLKMISCTPPPLSNDRSCLTANPRSDRIFRSDPRSDRNFFSFLGENYRLV